MKKTISIIIPIHNEEENIPLVYDALRDVWSALPLYEYEYIFVNDGSTDKSDEKIASLLSSDKRVKYIEFSRNFGKEMATTAGIQAATGDAIIMVDADLQHPPQHIPELVSRWEKGAEIVIGLRSVNHGEGFTKRVGSWLFNKIMNQISETSMRRGETDFRLIDRSVADAFLNFPEHNRMTRSLINWLGFKKDYITFAAPARAHGEAQYSTRKLVHLAIYYFVTNSLEPLRLAGYLGVVITSSSFVLGVIVFFDKYVFADPFGWKVTGSGQLAIITVFLVGIILMVLGIMSLYIGSINSEVTGRPLYVVRKKINF